MNITTAYRQMAQASYDEAMKNVMVESVQLEAGKMVTLTVPFPGSNEDKIIAQAKEIGSKNGFTVLGGEYDRYDEAVYVKIKGDSSKLTKWVNKWMRSDDSEEEIVNDYSESVDATESALNEVEENEFSHSKNKKENYAKFLAANAKRVGKPMIDGGLKSNDSDADKVNGKPANGIIYLGDGFVTYNDDGDKVVTDISSAHINLSQGIVPWSTWKDHRETSRISVPAGKFKEIAKIIALASKI